MKRLNQTVGWGLFLLLSGIFLLLWKLGVMDPWGDLAWGALYALAGLGFLIWFAFGVGHWWRAIPAFTLLSIGAMIILGWRGVNLGEWRAPIVLFGMALGFWAIVIVRKEHWWAVVPAGVLTTVGVLFGLWSRLIDAGRPAVLYIGIGLVFLLLYAIRYDEADARWASVPAGALLLLGTATLAAALELPGVLAEWWPVALVVLGLVLTTLGFAIRRPAAVAPAPAPSYDVGGFGELPPAPGASVLTDLPPAEPLPVTPRPVAEPGLPVAEPGLPVAEPLPPAPVSAPPSEPAGEPGDVDIYKIIEEQPAEKPLDDLPKE